MLFSLTIMPSLIYDLFTVVYELFVTIRIPTDLMIPTDFEMANWCTAFCLVLWSMRGREMASSVQFALSFTCCVTRALIFDIILYGPMLGPVSVALRLGLAARVLVTRTIHGYIPGARELAWPMVKDVRFWCETEFDLDLLYLWLPKRWRRRRKEYHTQLPPAVVSLISCGVGANKGSSVELAAPLHMEVSPSAKENPDRCQEGLQDICYHQEPS